MPDDNVYNGDIGLIDRITLSPKKEIHIDFDDNIVRYTPANFINFRLAYSISIHKSQGSEFDEVLVIQPEFNSYLKNMTSRELIYTAVTRAKKSVSILGEYDSINLALATRSNQRITVLSSFLK